MQSDAGWHQDVGDAQALEVWQPRASQAQLVWPLVEDDEVHHEPDAQLQVKALEFREPYLHSTPYLYQLQRLCTDGCRSTENAVAGWKTSLGDSKLTECPVASFCISCKHC